MVMLENFSSISPCVCPCCAFTMHETCSWTLLKS
ncbi:hypothetical protein CsSME_00000260 [Camellia sinensis var. sinensis]